MGMTKTEEERYTEACAVAAARDFRTINRWVTHFCPECRDHVFHHDARHVTIVVPGWDHAVVIVTCGGLRVIPPAAVGMACATWDGVTDDERTRVRVVHGHAGWTFRDLSEADRNGIRRYLATGNPVTLPAAYASLRLALVTPVEG